MRRFRIQVNRTSSTFPYQESSIQRTGTTEYWMSTFFEMFHHDISSSFRLVVVRSTPFCLLLLDRGMTSVQAETFLRKSWTFSEFERHSLEFFFFCPINIVEHGQEDDPILKFLWTCLTKLPVCLEYFGESAMLYVLRKYSTRTQVGSPPIPKKLSVFVGLWDVLKLIFPLHICFCMLVHLPQTQN